eukprot:3971323-Amphidinium_carterae.1
MLCLASSHDKAQRWNHQSRWAGAQQAMRYDVGYEAPNICSIACAARRPTPPIAPSSCLGRPWKDFK